MVPITCTPFAQLQSLQVTPNENNDDSTASDYDSDTYLQEDEEENVVDEPSGGEQAQGELSRLAPDQNSPLSYRGQPAC